MAYVKRIIVPVSFFSTCRIECGLSYIYTDFVLQSVLGIDHQMAIDDLDLDHTKFLNEMIEIDRDSFLMELIESISISINFQKQVISGLLHNVKTD